jgi:hypothetical protein
MPLRIISKREDQLLKRLFSEGIGPDKIDDILNTPGFIDDFRNFLSVRKLASDKIADEPARQYSCQCLRRYQAACYDACEEYSKRRKCVDCYQYTAK